MEDCIKILNLPDEFDLKTLKKVYRKQVKKYHPDKAASEEERVANESMMKLINNAYEVLKNYLDTHGGKYTKPKENNSYNNSYNTYNATEEESKAEKKDNANDNYRSKKYTDEEIWQKAEDFLNRFNEQYEKRARAKAEEAKKKEKETSYNQDQTREDSSYTDEEKFKEEKYDDNYEEALNREISFDELFVILKIYFWQLQKAILFKPKKVVWWALGLIIAFIIMYNTIIIDILYHIYMIGTIIFVLFKLINTKMNAIKESGSVINYLKKIREEVEQEKSLRRVHKCIRKHEAEREKIERERMQKFEEEWERKHSKKNTNR